MLSIYKNQTKLPNLSGPDTAMTDQFKNFERKVDIYLETGNYIVCTAQSFDELVKGFTLRNEVFLQKDNSSLFGYDYDEFDTMADHLLIFDKNTNCVVATYRLICSMFSGKFYSEREFNLQDIFKPKTTYLEMGRACIQKAYRNSNLVDLLWRGVGSYCLKVGADTLFGVGSVYTTDPERAWQIAAYLHKYHSDNKFDVRAEPEWALASELKQEKYNFSDPSEFKKTLPSLIRSYLLAGAQIYGDPVLDQELGCVDFFAYIDLKSIHRSFRKRYLSA